MKAISRYFAMCAVALTGMTVASCTSDLVENSAASSRLVIDYTVEVDNSLMGEHHFEMVVS